MPGDRLPCSGSPGLTLEIWILEATLYYMARPAKYTEDEILDRSRDLVLESGPSGLTVPAVAELLAAPSGSIYYRFAGRDTLAAALWLRSVRRFQSGFLAALDQEDPLNAALDAALHVVHWSGTNLDDARLLLLFRGRDLVRDGWPANLRADHSGLQRRLEHGIEKLQAAFGAEDRESRHRVSYAVVDVPYAAVRPSLIAGRPPPDSTVTLVAETVAHVLGPLTRSG